MNTTNIKILKDKFIRADTNVAEELDAFIEKNTKKSTLQHVYKVLLEVVNEKNVNIFITLSKHIFEHDRSNSWSFYGICLGNKMIELESKVWCIILMFLSSSDS